MNGFQRPGYIWTTVILLLAQAVSATNESIITGPAPLKIHFKTWYPQVRQYLPGILVDNCIDEYSIYLGNATNPYPLSCKNCKIQPVVNCILDNWRESDKANMASAAVLLGLLPTILAMVGSSTIETGILALKRPVLAFFLAAGTPSVNPIRTFEYHDPQEILQLRDGALRMPELSGVMVTAVGVTQYLLAFGAVGNLAVVSYQLSVQTICSFAQETAFLPALYAFLAVAIHIAGSTAVALRYRFHDTSGRKKSVWAIFMQEITPSCNQDRSYLAPVKETPMFVILSWLTSTGTVLHIVFGTLVFSSLIFLQTQDALGVVLQYFASALVCRLILMYELSGMRNVVNVVEAGEAHLTSASTKQGYHELNLVHSRSASRS
ncbi:hypothetical protein K431DRAFT_296658 [Polychaeton citri CBS 116435]|uniref:Uncharacterized protein n=1 Tax=Polychaeton citri CBS 116435 TaxID=1314669 RepID=A0A9P4Q3G5_9PEZI|nr:hypothetical protein K431DRAFT_296658 [Polychaeton citri CBS 116435]